MDLQAHYSASPSKFIALKRRSPSPDRSESASLRLESGSVSSFTGSERTTAAVPSYRPEFRSSVQSLVDSVKSISMGHYLPSTTDHQAYHLTSASKYAALKGRSPSPDRSERASLRLDSESVPSFTAGSDSRTTSRVSSCYYSARSALFLSQPSFIELAESDEAPDKYVPGPFQSEVVIQRLISSPSTSEKMNEGEPSVEPEKPIGNSSYKGSKPKSYPANSFHMAPRIAEDIENPASLLRSDLVIVLMGPTGSGKSNFIDALTAQLGQRSGKQLESCTTEVHVRLRNHPVHGDRLVLVDTPWFDDTHKSDLKILQMVGKWLQTVYEKKIKLAGIMYLHRITDNRMAGSPHRNLRMFGELCGDQAVKKVVLVTTMWDRVFASSQKQQEAVALRERELYDSYRKTMVKHGAWTARFENTPASAWKIVDIILTRHEAEPEVPLLQEELVDLKRALNETAAGKTLYTWQLKRLLAEQRVTVGSLAQEEREENSPELAHQLETELKRIRKVSDKTFKEIKNLKIPFGKSLMLSFGTKSRGVS